MDRLAERLDVVSLPVAAALACAIALLLIVTPSRVRLPLALATMVIVLTVSRLSDIGPLASLAKVLSGFSFVVVAIAAYLQPGKRAPVPRVCWGYALVGAAGIWYVTHTEDHTLAIVIRVQWLLLAVSAILTARTVVDERSLRRVLLGILGGCGVASLITFSAIVVAPIQALQNGFGRFMPYQVNPNQIGVLFAITIALGMYFSLRLQNSVAKALIVGITAIALGQGVLTLSRGSFLVIALAATPSVFVALRRPLFAIASLSILGTVLVLLVRAAESSDFEHVNGSIEHRTHLTLAVLDEFRERPWFGLASTDGLEAYDADLNAHNAYVEMLYLGGLSLALPMFALQFLGHWQMVRVWMRRRQLPVDPLLVSVLAGLSIAIFAHGFVNNMILYPTYTWAFLNVFVACLFISLRPRAARSMAALRLVPLTKSTRTLPPRSAAGRRTQLRQRAAPTFPTGPLQQRASS
jgi:hypothetical protein